MMPIGPTRPVFKSSVSSGIGLSEKIKSCWSWRRHWDDEWEKHLASQQPALPWPAASSSAKSAHKLAQYIEQIATFPDDPRIEKIPIGGVPVQDLTDWINEVLPGLTDSQVELLLSKARAIGRDDQDRQIPGGSPRVLEELLKWLVDRPRAHFVDGDLQKPLHPKTEQDVANEINDLNDIVANRFKGLSPEIQRILGWSSFQGRSISERD